MKRTFTFLICAGMVAACIFEMWSVAAFLWGAKPLPMEVSGLKIDRQEERWIGAGRSRTKETFTLAEYLSRPLLIIGDPTGDGWLLPPAHPGRYGEGVQDLASGRDLVVFYRFHPYVSFSLSALAAAVILAICVLICYGCLFSRDGI